MILVIQNAVHGRRDFVRPLGPAVVVLALVPFVRQNLLIASLLLVGVVVVGSRRWWLLAPYGLVLALPLIHNLYYADEFRFLVENRGWTAGFGNHPQGMPISCGISSGQRFPSILVTRRGRTS